MSYLLIVIDMQKWFFQHNDYNMVIRNCENQLRHAVSVGASIIFLRYKNAGKTISSLTNITKNYPKVWEATKDIEDGSSWIKELCDLKKINTNLIKVAGVQTDMCVFNTVEGLKELYPHSSIQVLKNSCGAIYNIHHNYAIKAMSKFNNVSII